MQVRLPPPAHEAVPFWSNVTAAWSFRDRRHRNRVSVRNREDRLLRAMPCFRSVVIAVGPECAEQRLGTDQEQMVEGRVRNGLNEVLRERILVGASERKAHAVGLGGVRDRAKGRVGGRGTTHDQKALSRKAV